GPSGWGYERERTQVGGDVRWGISNNLTLNGTAHPDFAEVESDAGQFVIDPRNALFFPEKRPFFLDGIEHFQVPSNRFTPGASVSRSSRPSSPARARAPRSASSLRWTISVPRTATARRTSTSSARSATWADSHGLAPCTPIASCGATTIEWAAWTAESCSVRTAPTC